MYSLLHILAAIGVTAGSSLDGGTTHTGALLVRLGAVLWIVAVAHRRTELHDRPQALVWSGPLAAVAALALSSVAIPKYGTSLQGLVAALFVFGVYFASWSHTTAAGMASSWPFFIGLGSTHAVWALIQALALGDHRGRGGFFDPNDLAAFLAPVLAYSLARALTMRNRLAIGTTVVLGGGLIATLSRAGLVAAVAATLLVLWSRSRRAAIFAAIALVAIAGTSPHIRQRFISGAHDPYAYSRLDIWRASVEVALEHPFGVGLGGYDEAMAKHGVALRDSVLVYPRRAHHAHSEPLNLWVELGWPGVGAVLVALATILIAIGRLRWTEGSGAALDELAVFVSFAIPASLAASLHVAPVALLAALWAGELVARTTGTPTDAAPVRARPTSARWLVPVVLTMAWLMTIPAALAYQLTESAAAAQRRGDLETALARAALARELAPSSLPTAMLHESLTFAQDQDLRAAAERLAELADQHPHAARPVERAAWLMEQLARRDPQGAPSHLQLALALRRETLRREPTVATHHLALAHTLERADDQASARAALEAALVIEPRCAKALAWLALDDERRSETRLATERARAALEAARHARRFGAAGKALLELDAKTQEALAMLAAAPRDR